MIRFDYDAPPHPDCPGLVDWIVTDGGERISVAVLVNRANKQWKALTAIAGYASLPEGLAREAVADIRRVLSTVDL